MGIRVPGAAAATDPGFVALARIPGRSADASDHLDTSPSRDVVDRRPPRDTWRPTATGAIPRRLPRRTTCPAPPRTARHGPDIQPGSHLCIDAGRITTYDAPKWSKVVGSGD